MRKIVVDARMCLSSGVGRYIRNILSCIAERGEFDIICLVHEKGDLSASLQKQISMKIVKPRIYSISEQLILPMSVGTCDIFWSPHYNIPLLPIKAKKRVVTIHDVCHLAFYNRLSFHKKLYAKLLLNNAVRISDLIFTVSDFSENEICRLTGISPKKIRKIHNGVDAEFFKQPVPSLKSEEILKNFHSCAEFFLYVGNVKPHKNIDAFLDAYKLFIKKFGNKVKVVVIGKQFSGYPLKDRIARDPVLCNRVFFYSDISDDELLWFYRHAIATILPSLYEGFGFSPLEAMASGCPAIVSNSGSIPEVCGDAAYYIDPKSIEELFNGLSRVYKECDYRASLIKKGKRRVEYFIWKKAADEHIKAFNHLFS